MMAGKKRNEYSKWKSRRWIVTVWSMLLVSAICILGIIYKEGSYVAVASALVAIPIAFTSLETLNKKWKYYGEGGGNHEH